MADDFVFKIGDQVLLRSNRMPPFRMFVVGNASCDDRGLGGAFAQVFWLDSQGRPHREILPELILEIQEAAPDARDVSRG